MRENTGVILWILVFAFGIIWVLQDTGALDVVGNTTGQNIIVVDGDPIHYDEYVRAVDAQMQQYQQQTGETMPPQMVDQVREQVYQALVEDKLREHEMDRLGITVTDEEIYEMVMGENPHQIIKVYFGDGQGGVNRALLQNFVNNPEARQDWIQIENYLRQERRREKIENLISATVRVTEQDVRDEYLRRNQSATAEWVGLRFAALPDDSVQVTDSDLRRFYNEHKEEFARPRTYAIDFVTRSKQPTAADSARIAEELGRLRSRFAQAEDDSLFLARNASAVPYTGSWFQPNELDAEIASAVYDNLEPGQIIGPVFTNGQAHLIKVQDVRPAEKTAVRARHILFRGDDAQTREQAEEVLQRIRDGADFAAMARQFSADGSAANGGDLGWFGRGQMVAPFEEAAFNAREGEIVGPVQTQFGYHLIQVTGRADREVKLADYVLDVRADIATLNQMQEDLEDLRYYAEESGDFEQEAQRLNLPVQQLQVEADQQFLPGLGNSRAISNFLAQAEPGDISQVIELNDQFVTVHLREVTPEGYRPFDEVRPEIEPRVKNELKAEILQARLERALEQHDFEGLAQALGETQRTAQNVSFNSMIIPTLGREPKFAGTVLGMEEGEVSDVVVGENAVFVAKVTSKRVPGELDQQTRMQIRNQLLAQRRNQVRNQWLTSLKEQAEVQDLRYRFQL